MRAARLLACALAALLAAAAPARRVTVWIDAAGSADVLSRAEDRAATFRRLAESGATGIAVECVDREGRRRFLSAPDRAALAEVIRDARAAKLRVHLVHLPFAAPPDAPDEQLQRHAVRDAASGELRLVSSREVAGNARAELSPAHPAVRERAVAEARALDQLGADSVILAGFGFEAPLADFSAQARRSFERDTRRTVRRWPAEVLASAPLRARWQTWRAETLRSLLFDIRTACATRIGVLVDGPYQRHADRGLNWADRARAGVVAQRLGIGDADYAATSASHLVDFIVLAMPAPAATEGEASARGWQLWASRTAIGDSARIAVGDSAALWGAVTVDALEGTAPAFGRVEDILLMDLTSLRTAGFDRLEALARGS
jgi:hypothetical protein